LVGICFKNTVRYLHPGSLMKGGMLMKIGQALVEQDAALAGEAKTWENIDSRERRAAI